MPSRQSWSNAIGSRSSVGEALVEHVEQLEERHVGADVVDLVGLERAGRVGPGLAPHLQRDLHRARLLVTVVPVSSVVVTCTTAGRGGRTRTRAAPCAASGSAWSPVYSQAPTYAKSSSSRSASPSSVWCSTRKCPPQLSSRWSASRHSSSPNSRKSATRPALLERLVERLAVAEDADVLPELLAQRRDLGDRLGQALLAAGHAAVVPHDLAELAVEPVDGAAAVDRQELVHLVGDALLGVLEHRIVGRDGGRSEQRREVVVDRRRQHEVAVGEALHQRAGPEPVGAVVGEVRLAEHVEPGMFDMRS